MTTLQSFLWTITLLAVVASGEHQDEHNEHDDHDEHDDHGFYEWGGAFETSGDMYAFVMQKTGDSAEYAHDGMKITVLPLSNGTDAALGVVEPEAVHALELNCTTVTVGTIIVPHFDECYWVVLDDHVYQTTVLIDTGNFSHVAIFTEHAPEEFDAELKSSQGEDVTPLHTLPETNTTTPTKPWGQAIGASFVVWLCTLIGMVLIVPCLKNVRNKYETKFDVLLSAFASGAILATAAFLIFIEAAHLLESKWTNETDVKWRWGACVLGGFISVNVVDALVEILGKPASVEAASMGWDYKQGEETNVEAQKGAEVASGEKGVEEATMPARWRQVVGITIGEVLHNFVDGIFIGAAFTGCGTGFGWTVAAATVYHELAQEMADFFLLVGPAGLKPTTAMIINVAAGASVVVGVIVIFLIDVPTETLGLILAFGGGVYTEIATVESMARVHKAGVNGWTKLAAVGVFILGAVSIGLVLLDHEHCEVGASAHGGEGHAAH